MEVNLSGLQPHIQIVMVILLGLLTFIGKRMVHGMDRLTLSVENLNTSMATRVAKEESFEHRIHLLESKVLK